MDQRLMSLIKNNDIPFVATLDNAITNLILEKDKDEIIDEDTINRMSASLACFCYAAIGKFIAGQIKHGGQITDKDLNKEIKQEVTDLFWYLSAQDWKNEINENECKEIDTSQHEN